MTLDTQRLFFALWPTSSIKQAITQNTNHIKNTITGNYVSPSNWHITLVFLGQISYKNRMCLIEQAELIQCGSFLLEFNLLHYFKKSKTLYFGVEKTATNRQLNLLVKECKRIQKDCGLKIETRDYLPHITIAKKATKPNQEILMTPVTWQVNEFVLVSSKVTAQGSQYSLINNWPLVAT